VEKILELLEIYRILGGFHLKSRDECLQLMVAVDTTALNVIEDLMLVKEAAVLAVKGLESAACPGSRGLFLGGGLGLKGSGGWCVAWIQQRKGLFHHIFYIKSELERFKMKRKVNGNIHYYLV
jgi:hypothetical protein